MIVYHYDDLDGITAAAIIHHSVGDGGHKNAAGAKLTLEQLIELYEAAPHQNI